MSPWNDKTVVIVDDMDHVRTELEKVYRGLGLNVVGVARDGIEALTLIRNLKPDLVSLDIIMPEMDGIECYLRMKEVKDAPKVLFVTYLANEPKFIDAYREKIPEELFMPKGSSEKVFRSRLNFLFGDGTLLNEDPSLHEPLSLRGVAEQQALDEPTLDFE